MGDIIPPSRKSDSMPDLQDQPSLPARLWTAKSRSAAAQGLRVMIGCAVAYALAEVFGLKQGQWAVFTVLIVMQGSVGATAGAAVDRLWATVAGALLGGAVMLCVPHRIWAVGAALVVAVGLTAFMAARQPRLRSAVVTVAIVLLTRPSDMPVGEFVLARILEITLGGVIGVMASRLVLPAQSGNVMIDRFRSVLGVMADMLCAQADALEKREVAFSVEDSIALRKALVAAEALLVEARRERSMMLARHDISEAIPRTLWRIRNGVVHLGRLLDVPLPPDLVALVGEPAGAMLREEAEGLQACRNALGTGEGVTLGHGSAEAFEAAFNALEHADATRNIAFEEIGRLFGLAFTLRKLRQDIDDLADRIAERG